ncbi:MAG: aldo/keto reductase [Clostridiales bacterium]|nr:aldo/keto reductase [Clostridiales bacterium]MBR2223529.1 aldo/keto reductase [Christensenellaceae bacterium]MBR3843661.1 aldo/keto reductase [Christensenellaceae bacterium]
MKKLTDTFVLKNGVAIPCVGFGTWQSPDGEVATAAVQHAVECGYRHVDTAAGYGNEGSVAEGIRRAGVKREEIFITSKLANGRHGYEETLKAFEESLALLKTDYLDLYLIHWPAPKATRADWERLSVETWKAFEKLYKDGRIRAIGLSNFKTHHIEHILRYAEIMPMVDQIEYHISWTQDETVETCKKYGILTEAWSPLRTGEIFKNEKVKAMAEKYGRSMAQLCIRWVLQKGLLPLPKSVTPSRIEENAKIFDFNISAEDMAYLDSIDDCGWSGKDPDTVWF